jgi:arginine transport system permease protein
METFVLLQQNLPSFMTATLTTLELMICALVCGLILALFMTTCLYLRIRVLQVLVNIFIFFIRGTPMLVQFFIIYYGAGQFAWIKQSIFWWMLKEPFMCAVLALAFNTAAYTTILLYGALKSVPKASIEVCTVLGMSQLLALRKVILPQAIRIALPAYANEVVVILKSTALSSTITLLDLTAITNQLIAQTYATFEILGVAALIYLVINLLIIRLFQLVEHSLQCRCA